MRSSGPWRASTPAVLSRRGTSCSGTGYIRSISPDSSAATRVAALPMGVKTAFVRLCPGVPHQFGFGTSTVRVSGTHSSSMNGPVPLTLRFANVFTVAPSSRPKALFASSHSLSMIQKFGRLSSSVGSGYFVTMSMVWSSTLSIFSMEFTTNVMFDAGSRMRSRETSTSSAVKSLPLWNFTPLRRLKRQEVGLVCSQSVARAGCSDRSQARWISPS